MDGAVITRRAVIASAAAAALIRPRPLRAVTTGVTPVFIHFGGMGYSFDNPSRQNAVHLSPPQWQFRAPFFCDVLGNHRLSCLGVQSDMDIEIQAAANAGIQAFMFLGAPKARQPGVYKAWDYYNASPYKSSLKWAGYVGPEDFGFNPWSNTAEWQANCNYYVNTHFNTPNYLKLGGRPVLFVSWHQDTLATHFAGSTANCITSFNYLRSQAVAAGVGNPYIVAMGDPYGSNPTSHEAKPWVTGDAISNYVPNTVPTALPNTAADLDVKMQAWWAAQVALGDKYVPNALMGWDVRPLQQLPQFNSPRIPWNGTDQYFIRGTNAEIAANLQHCIDFIGANQPACDSKIMLVYAWNECSEGGTAGIPTLGDPPTGSPPTTNLLSAIKPVLTAAA
jgi:hypothetical protein